ncbi:patatin-like phospholipase family protein [Chromobacterium violaceum]
MSEINTLVLGGGGSKGIVYPQAIEVLSDPSNKLIDLYKIKHIIGSSAGALTGYILCMGGTTTALKYLSPSMSEALPFAKKGTEGASLFRILVGGALGHNYTESELDGSSIPSILNIITRAALANALTKVNTEFNKKNITKPNTNSFIRGEEWSYEAYDSRLFLPYEIPGDLGELELKELYLALASAWKDLDISGCYLVSTHRYLLAIFTALGINNGWKELTVTCTRLFSDRINQDYIQSLESNFGSLNYISSKVSESAKLRSTTAFNQDRTTCLLSAAVASGSYPLLFSPCSISANIHDRSIIYTDGGCLSNLPAEAILHIGEVNNSKDETIALAIGLNSTDEIGETLTFIPKHILRAISIRSSFGNRIIIPKSNSSFSIKKKKIIQSENIATESKNGKLFKAENYKIYYAAKQPIHPISLTLEYNEENINNPKISASIEDYCTTIKHQFEELLKEERRLSILGSEDLKLWADQNGI